MSKDYDLPVGTKDSDRYQVNTVYGHEPAMATVLDTTICLMTGLNSSICLKESLFTEVKEFVFIICIVQ